MIKYNNEINYYYLYSSLQLLLNDFFRYLLKTLCIQLTILLVLGDNKFCVKIR